MAKINKFLIAICLLVSIIAVAFYVFKNNRSYSSPTEKQIQLMQEDSKLCYKDDDCWVDNEKYVSCNGPVGNKYFCQKNGCSVTEMICSKETEHMLSACENNICKAKK